MESPEKIEEKAPKTSHLGKIFLYVLVLIIISLAGYYVFNKEKKTVDTGDDTSLATTTVTIGGVTMTLPPGTTATVEPIADTANVGIAPALLREVVFPADFPLEARQIWATKVETAKDLIAQDKYSYNGWNSLALLLDTIGDYEGALQIWEYLAKLYPKDGIVFANLGFIYGYHFHDNVKAEGNFKTAIKNSPQTAQMYQQAFEFYRDVLKDYSKARAVALDGKETTGNDTVFDSLLETIK